MKVIVLGLGAMGSATCHHLATRGVEVLGLDQFEPPHAYGSHHGGSRMIRQSYYEHPDYVPLLLRAYKLWRDLERSSGEDILQETGGLYLGPPSSDIISGSLRAAEEHHLPYELLDKSSLRRRFPQFRAPNHFVGFFEPRAGFLRPEAAIRAHLSSARQHGATIQCGQKVDSWECDDNGVTVICGNQSHQADHVIVTAGAWSGPLLRGIGLPLTVTRQVSAWFRPTTNQASLAADQMPCWFVESDPPYGHYGFPTMSDSGLLKIALHKSGSTLNPDTTDPPQATEEELDQLSSFLAQFIPDAAGNIENSQVCRYTNSPDQHFLLGPHPQQPNVTIAAGFSGHGFKFSSVIGELLADLALDGHPRLPIDFLSPTRSL